MNSQRAVPRAKLVEKGEAILGRTSTQAPGTVAQRTSHEGPINVGSSLASGGRAGVSGHTSADAFAPIVGLDAPVGYVTQAGARVPVYAPQLQQDSTFSLRTVPPRPSSLRVVSPRPMQQ